MFTSAENTGFFNFWQNLIPWFFKQPLKTWRASVNTHTLRDFTHHWTCTDFTVFVLTPKSPKRYKIVKMLKLWDVECWQGAALCLKNVLHSSTSSFWTCFCSLGNVHICCLVYESWLLPLKKAKQAVSLSLEPHYWAELALVPASNS